MTYSREKRSCIFQIEVSVVMGAHGIVGALYSSQKLTLNGREDSLEPCRPRLPLVERTLR